MLKYLDTIPKTIYKGIRKEAEKLGMTLEEYLVEILSQDLDPKNIVKEYY